MVVGTEVSTVSKIKCASWIDKVKEEGIKNEFKFSCLGNLKYVNTVNICNLSRTRKIEGLPW